MTRHRMYRYTVEGRGEFPYDMLRYDASYPATETDSGQLYTQVRGKRTVTLYHDTIGALASLGWHPCEDRWKSFLWRVTDVQEVD